MQEKDIILELQEDNRLLSTKIEVYKEEIASLKSKIDYANKLFALYENIMDESRKEIKTLNDRIRELEEKLDKKNNE